MTLAIAHMPQQHVQLVQSPEWDANQVTILKEQICPGANDAELKYFGEVCKRTGLDPFQRQIYFVKRKGKMVIQMGIDGLRLQAVRSERYAGNDDPKFDEGLTRFEMLKEKRSKPVTATATVWAIVGGTRCPFTATVEWDAYVPSAGQDFQWKKMPFTMLGKCAESAAIRKAFPAETSGYYTSEEMAQAGPGDVAARPSDASDQVKAAFEKQLNIHPNDRLGFFFKVGGGKKAHELSQTELEAVLEKIKNAPKPEPVQGEIVPDTAETTQA